MVCNRCPRSHDSTACPVASFSAGQRMQSVLLGQHSSHCSVRPLHFIPCSDDGNSMFVAACAALSLDRSPTALRHELVVHFIVRSPDMLFCGVTFAEWIRWDCGLEIEAYSRIYSYSGRCGGLELHCFATILKCAFLVFDNPDLSGVVRLTSVYGSCNRMLPVVHLVHIGRLHFHLFDQYELTDAPELDPLLRLLLH